MKNKLLFLFLLLLSISLIVQQAKAVSEAALLFLLIQPSIRANGMAGASVAVSNHDAFSVAFNPAHIGFITCERSFNYEFYLTKTKWLPQLNLENLTFDAKSVLIGYNLRKLNKNIPISIGAGYTRIFINLGEQLITGETPEVIGTFNSFEKAEIWSVGMAFDYFVKVGFGMNFKYIESNLSQVGVGAEKGSGSISAKARDFGIFVQLPIIQILSKFTQEQIKIGGKLIPFFNTGIGLSKSNISKHDIVYIDAAQADPWPRIARMGISVNTGFFYSHNNNDLRALSFEWSSEAEDLLVKRNAEGDYSYEDGFGQIDFFKNVIKANADNNVINSKGWEINLLDIISIRHGSREDPDGKVFYDASGFGISATGLINFIGFIYPDTFDNEVLKFISQHVDIQYNRSSIDAGEGHPLDQTNFNGVKISFF